MPVATYPEDSAAAWETKMTKKRLHHAFVEGFAQTTAATRDGNDPVTSGSSGGYVVSSSGAFGQAAVARAATRFAALMP